MEKQKNKIRFLLIFIIILTSFLLWFNANKIYFIKTNNLSLHPNYIELNKNSNIEEKINLELFWKVYDLVNKNYYSKEKIEDNKIIYWIIKWYIESLWDKFSEFLDPESTKIFLDSLSWNFEWIWAVVEKHELWVLVDSVLKWSPALNGWIFSKDIIIEANWNNLEWIDLIDAINFIKWPDWSSVSLKILRVWEREILQKTIIRKKNYYSFSRCKRYLIKKYLIYFYKFILRIYFKRI